MLYVIDQGKHTKTYIGSDDELITFALGDLDKQEFIYRNDEDFDEGFDPSEPKPETYPAYEYNFTHRYNESRPYEPIWFFGYQPNALDVAIKMLQNNVSDQPCRRLWQFETLRDLRKQFPHLADRLDS